MSGHHESSVSRPRAVLFDWDNTLVENWRSIQAALNVALLDFGLSPMGLEQVRFQGRHSAREIFPKLFGAGWPRAREIFEAHLREHHLAGLRIMPGAEAAMEAFRGKEIGLGIVSNKKGDLLRREIDHLGWVGRFASVVGAQDATADKPDPAPVHLALESMGLTAGSDIWLVGDTDIDMRTAIAAGCTPVLIGTISENPGLFADAKPFLIYDDCGGLAGFVRGRWDTISLES